jgi:DNA repair exonuclease SbcCD ATPase subunit
MKILSLTSENIKRLKAVEIAPGGCHVAVVGRNEQGKSSVLDSIMYALGGKDTVCERPIRDGESAAKIVVELDEYTVTRTFTAAGGGSLKVVAKNGKISSPQAILDGLVGALTFDPLEFTRRKDQADVLRKLVGLDTSALEAEHDKVYFERTEIGRQESALAGKIGGRHTNDLLPDAEIDVKDILAAGAEVVKRNDAIRSVQNTRDDIRRDTNQNRIDTLAQCDLIASLELQLAEANNKKRLLDAQYSTLVDRQAALVVPPLEDLTGFDQQILNAQKSNADIRANNELKANVAMRDSLIIQYNEKTKRLDAVEAEIDKTLSSVKYPIQGLGFSGSGSVTFNGVPFEQLSTAQRLKISAAIGIALNPKLRVMLIRDGSVLDDETLAALVSIAEASDTQLWIERVGKSLDGELPGVIIEDGTVVASTLVPRVEGQ